MILSIILSSIFFILGMIHFNWVFGGQFGFDSSLPTNASGKRVLNPNKIDSAIVGIFLNLFGFVYLYKTGIFDFKLSTNLIYYSGWIISIIFILRAIGDFKYVGFFKKVKNTKFAHYDSKLFTPLCLFIGISGLIIQFEF